MPDDNTLIQIADAIRDNEEAKILLGLRDSGIKNFPCCTNKAGIFANCKNLYCLVLPDTFEADLSYKDFENCSSLSFILIDKNNKKYSSLNMAMYTDNGKTFYMCPPGKKDLTISANTSKILSSAFTGCDKLSEIVYEGSLKEWFAISKEDKWDDELTLHAIHCSDADIILKNEEKAEEAVKADTSAYEILEEFKDWLIESDGMNQNSAKDYKSHINSIIRLTDSEKEKGWFEKNILLSETNRKNSLKECVSLLEKKKCPFKLENRT